MSLRQRVFGRPLDLRNPNLFRHIALIAFFAWVGLGADGLSSSAYGPEEAFRHLEGHYYLAVFLAMAMAATVFIISYSYTRIIEHFPTGGGGYLVASKLLGDHAGVVSGCALLVDYVLTITTSVASGANAIFALLPASAVSWKLATEVIVICVLVVMNLRGVKESVYILTPIFICFVLTHAVLIFGAIVPHLGDVRPIASEVRHGLSADLATMGAGALLLVFLRAYSLGGSAYTGIEAVSNGLAIMREPRVDTGKRTMFYMATSLAVTAGGILLAYLLVGVHPSETEPMNSLLAKQVGAGWHLGSIAIGESFVILTLVAEGALLFVAAQTGFIDGPRVMANMALDSWLPHQFAALSERLTMRNGVYLMGGIALLTLFYTGGNIHVLVVMYSINVFVTFSLSNLGMTRLWLGQRHKDPAWSKHLVVHLLGLTLCAGILVITVLEKFTHGGWVTLVVTSVAIALCYAIRSHYRNAAKKIRKLDQELQPILADVPELPKENISEMDPEKATAAVLVGGYGGLGMHTLLQIERVFPGQFRQVMFISAGVIDSGTFKGAAEIEALRTSITEQLERYVQFTRNKLGWAADYDMIIGTEAVAELERLCREINLRFPRSVFFAGKLIFREPTWWHRLLHNETAHAVQRRLEFDNLPMVVLPVRILK